jgi:hypothetical protein
MSAVPVTPTPTAQVAMTTTNSIFDKILTYLEVATEIMSVVPSPAQPFAPIALSLEKIIGGAIAAKAAATGQTVDQVIAQLHQIAPIP